MSFQQIKNEAGQKSVILVEGASDVFVLSYFFNQMGVGWDAGVLVKAAGDKNRVQKWVKRASNWVGIVDKDMWSVEKTIKLIQDSPQLHILPRFCVENYFCVPSELWNALPAIQKQGKNYGDFEQQILQKLPDWVAHGALWRVIQKRRSILIYDSAFPSALDASPVTDIDKIRDILHTWYAKLDPEQIIQEYQYELEKAQELSEDDLLKTYVHGKNFFNTVVVNDVLNDLFGQKSANEWQQLLANTNGLALPTDLESFLQDVLDDVRGLLQ